MDDGLTIFLKGDFTVTILSPKKHFPGIKSKKGDLNQKMVLNKHYSEIRR